MTETHELKRVLSNRSTKIQGDQFCSFCNCPLSKGTEVTNYGIVDRRNRQWSRLYFCTDHGDILMGNPEDLPNAEQQYLFEHGFINEIWER